MQKSRLINTFEKIFMKGNVSKEVLYNICNTDDITELISLLFTFLNEELKYYNEKDISFLPNVLDFIIEITMEKNEIYKKTIKKTYENIERILLSCKNGYNQESEKNLLILKTKLLKLEDSNIMKNQEYELIISIIEWYKNIDYLQIVLNKYPELSNLKDSNGVSLYMNITLKYINEVENLGIDDNLKYYNNVLLTIKASRKFLLEKNEKLIILEKVKQSLRNLNKNDEYSKVKKVLLQEISDFNFENIDIGQFIKKNNINIKFSNNLLNELDKYNLRASMHNKNRIYIKDYTISIDKSNSYELDDALTIRMLDNGNYLLGVHIANVLGYLPYESSLVKNAINKGSTIYFPRNRNLQKGSEKLEIIPIFPLRFSSNMGSLLENEKRLAHSYFFELDSSANVVNYSFLKTIIKVNNNSNYEHINDVLKNGSNDKILENNINLLNELTYKLEDKYRKRNNEGKYSRAELIVELTTRLTNQMIANYFYENSFPFLYRVHELNRESLTSLENDLSILMNRYGESSVKELYGNLKNICNCRYDTFGVHEGLRGIHYAHATAPLRRGSDLIVEHALDVCYFNKPSDKELYKLELDIKSKKDILNFRNSENQKLLKEYSMLSSSNKSVKKLKK